MGGSISVVCRKTNGEVHSLLRWTNPLPGFVHHPQFLAKDEEYMQEYIDQQPPWGDPDEKQEILPSEYGIVFIDWQNNKIIAANGYTSFGHGYTTEWEFPGSFTSQPEDKNRTLFEQGKVKAVVEMFAQPGKPQDGFLVEGLSYEDFIEKVRAFTSVKDGGIRRGLCAVVYDMEPFEIINLMDSEEDFAKFKELVEAEGVEVDAGWDDWIAERFEDF